MRSAVLVAAAAGGLIALVVMRPRLIRGRARLRRVLAADRGGWVSARVWWRPTRTGWRTGRTDRRVPPTGWSLRVAMRRWAHPRGRRGRATWTTVLIAAAAGVAVAASGPVAGLVAVVYAGLLSGQLRRRAEQRRSGVAYRQRLDELRTAAAELRAGLPVATALAGTGLGELARARTAAAAAGAPERHPADRRVGVADRVVVERVRAAVSLAERTGAPLADLFDRIEADARAQDRALAAAQAQAAGARATTWLLAGLPIGGLGLGFAIGTDPLRVLLHTPVGAVCALGAVALQLGGLAWSRRLMRVDGATP